MPVTRFNHVYINIRPKYCAKVLNLNIVDNSKLFLTTQPNSGRLVVKNRVDVKHIGVYRYTSVYTGIPCVYQCSGITCSYFTDIFIDFSEFTTNFG
jgi:hypothetical protein